MEKLYNYDFYLQFKKLKLNTFCLITKFCNKKARRTIGALSY